MLVYRFRFRVSGSHRIVPTGLHGPKNEWERIEAPLRKVDPIIESFGQRHGLSATRNYHNWPERSLRRRGALRRLIQVYLAETDTLTWHVWICASEDRSDGRYWKSALLGKNLSTGEMQSGMERLLEESWVQLARWSRRTWRRLE